MKWSANGKKPAINTRLKGSTYDEDFPELTVLVKKFNELVKDTKAIEQYLTTVGIKSDTLKMSQVLTPLEPNTMWYANKEGIIENFPIGQLNEKYDEMVEYIKVLGEKSVADKTELYKSQLLEYFNQLSENLNSLKEQYQITLGKLADTHTDGINKKYSDTLNEIERYSTTATETIKNKVEDTETYINAIKESTNESVKQAGQTIHTELNNFYQDANSKLSNSKNEMESLLNQVEHQKNEIKDDIIPNFNINADKKLQAFNNNVVEQKKEFDKYVQAHATTLKGEKGDRGERGEKGERGATGATGATGAPGTTDYNQLRNKPSLNFIPKSGNSTLSGSLTVTGNFYANGDVTAFSDKRLKANIERIENPLEKIAYINGYTFNMQGFKDRKAGVIAQEVIKVLPEVIHVQNGFYTVAYGNIVALLIECIKALQKEIETIKGGNYGTTK